MMVSGGTGMFNCTLGTFAATLSPTVAAVDVQGGDASVCSVIVCFFSAKCRPTREAKEERDVRSVLAGIIGVFSSLSLTVVASEVEGDGASIGTGRVGFFSGLFPTSSAVEVEGNWFAGASCISTFTSSGSPCLVFNSCAVNNKTCWLASQIFDHTSETLPNEQKSTITEMFFFV